MQKRLLLPLLFTFFSLITIAQDFKVVGYLPYYRFQLIEEIDFTKITHLNLAFLNPDINGDVSVADKDIDPIIAYAKTMNPEIVVFASMGGGVVDEAEEAYGQLLLPENISDFAHTLVEYVKLHDLDGIDVDLEWGMVTENYSPFVLVLADTLRSHGKQITAALPGTYRYTDLSQDALDTYDFINLMVYDKTGPWAPDSPGPHSSRYFATQSIDYWRNQGVDDEKMTLGVPFYGYDFSNTSSVSAFTFGSLVSKSRDYAYSDKVGLKYYNGIPTIQYKTLLAMNENLAGMMIWELGQDALGANSEFSLLSAIDYVIQTGEMMVTGIDQLAYTNEEPILSVYPNPFQNEIKIKTDGRSAEVRIYDLQGREQLHETFSDFEHTLTLNRLPGGLYVMKASIDGVQFSEKILKTL